MYIYYVVSFTLLFGAWLFLSHKRNQRLEDQARQEFWDRENLANQTRNKDISGLPLLHVEQSEIPAPSTDDEAIVYCIGQLHNIIKEPMIDLSAYTNTDLKLAYGVGNFKTLSDYDENFNNFLINLTNLARACTRASLHETAKEAYLLALRYGSAKLSDYQELARTYLALDQPEQISRLIQQTENGNLPRKDSIVRSLREILSDYR